MLVLSEPSSDVVRERWARAAGYGVRSESEAYPVGTSDADLDERRCRLADMLREERSLLEPIAARLGGGPLVAIVADRDGVILSAEADRQLVSPLSRVRLVAGARWGEETRGTNAIGTAIALGRSVGVVGEAHFEVRNRGLFCYATPVRDAFGDIALVLDVTGPLNRHDSAIGLAVEAAGATIERALRILAYGDTKSGALATIERLVHRSAGASILVEASGVVRVVNAAARRALELAHEPELTCERLFGVAFEVLLGTAALRGGMRFETRSGAWNIGIDPIPGPSGRTLALVVHLDTPAPPPSRRAASAPSESVESPELARILCMDDRVSEAKRSARRFAKTSLPVLLLAETGTGKELFARAIHASSDRARKPFIAINCGALSPNLIASELFGYAPGAFTGALRGGSEGRLGAANGGTLFLDEIAEMPEALQASLLRVLDNGTYQRVGESRERSADFRLICATCKDLPALVAEGKFRNDLFYRIHGASVTIPPLRDRSDVVWLAEGLIRGLVPGAPPTLSDDARLFIEEHDWPGNVRELKNAMAHAIALAAGEPTLWLEHLPRILATGSSTHRASPTTRRGIVRVAIEETLRACGGNVSEAARRLGVGRGTIYRASKRHGSD